MRSQRRGIVAGVLRIVPAGVLAWGLIGCDSPPDIVPITPPGVQPTRKAPDEEPAQAQGEMAAPALQTTAPTPTKTAEAAPAPPTAKGETKTTKGGVKYETLKEGTGPELRPGQAGQFLYEGRLQDGTVFDGNMQQRQPATFSLGRVIKGWQEGLPGMKVGELRRLTIPPEMGYGAQGSPPKIGPNATLIFDVELVGLPGQ
jgi:FKBP-type peptidyl-prolyl cis-trans isomerase